MNVILIYARIKDKLTKEDAYELNKLYMSGLTYKEAMDLQRMIDSKVDSILLDVFGNEDTTRKDNAFRLLSATLLWTYKEIEKEAMNQEINP